MIKIQLITILITLISFPVIVLAQDCNIAVVENVSNATCNNVEDGSISLDVSGGTPPYNFYWTHGSTDQNVTGLLSGEYKVKISDKLGCKFEKVIFVQTNFELDLNIELQNQGINEFLMEFTINDGSSASKSTLISYQGLQEIEKLELSENRAILSSGKYKLEIYNEYGCYVSKGFVVK